MNQVTGEAFLNALGFKYESKNPKAFKESLLYYLIFCYERSEVESRLHRILQLLRD